MSRKRPAILALCTVIAVVGAGCGNDARENASPPRDDSRAEGIESFEQPFQGVEAYPVLVNSEITVGDNRVLMGLLDDSDAPIGSPKIDLEVDYYDLEASTDDPVATDRPKFVWSVKNAFGVYVGDATFDRPGKWGAEVHIVGDGIDEKVKTSFEVQKEASTPAIGEEVPASDNLTGADVQDLATISTDPKPDPRFYRHSVKSALKENEPFVVTFATPKFCQTAVCGPTLDIVKDVARDFPRLTFIHVEPYELPAEPPDFKVVPSVKEWGLPSEPWVFVVNGDGTLNAKFEGVVGAAELADTLEEL